MTFAEKLYDLCAEEAAKAKSMDDFVDLTGLLLERAAALVASMAVSDESERDRMTAVSIDAFPTMVAIAYEAIQQKTSRH